jgi:hypothetical protein
MDWVDLMLLVTLASADLLLLVYLRQRRRRRLRVDRMRHSLVLAIRQVNQSVDPRHRAVAGSLAQY